MTESPVPVLDGGTVPVEGLSPAGAEDPPLSPTGSVGGTSQLRKKIQFAQEQDEQIRGMEKSIERSDPPLARRGRALSEAPYMSPGPLRIKRNIDDGGAGEGGSSPSSRPLASIGTSSSQSSPRDAIGGSKSPVLGALEMARLPRGGVYVETRLGALLIGSPAGSLKDVLFGNLRVPDFFFVPSDLFSRRLGTNLGLNLAELEIFALYRRYFISKTPIIVFCESEAVAESVRAVFCESLLPVVSNPDIELSDFTATFDRNQVPRLSDELSFLSRHLSDGSASVEGGASADKITVDALVDLRCFDGEESALNDGILKIKNETDSVCLELSLEEGHGGAVRVKEVSESGVRKMAVSGVVKLPDTLPMEIRHFQITPPLFGVTVLGNSNGFDPTGLSTGYVVWVNRRGILVNPPAYCAARLSIEMGIHPSLINCVILTSSHADFDAGAFQKILHEEQVVIHSTLSIYDSFIRKYSALSGLEPKMLRDASKFRQVKIGTPMKICGANSEFFYNLDSTPSLGFTITVGERKLLFCSGFTLAKDVVDAAAAMGVISKGRKKCLSAFAEDIFDRIFFDAPLSTAEGTSKILSSLADLSPGYREKLLINHCASTDFPGGLVKGPDGRGEDSSLVLEVEPPPYILAANLIESVEHTMFFKGLSIDHAASLVQIAERKLVKAGEQVMCVGGLISSLSVMVSGRIKVKYIDIPSDNEDEGDEDGDGFEDENISHSAQDSEWVTGDCFGEEALISGLSSVDAVAVTDLELIEIASSDLQWILAGTPVRDRIQRCHDMRLEFMSLERVLVKNSLLNSLTRAQKLAIEMNATVATTESGSCVWNRGEPAEFAIILVRGRVLFPNAIAKLMSGLMKKSGTMMIKKEDLRHNYCPDVFEMGAWIGNVSVLIDPSGVNSNTLQAVTDCTYFKIDASKLSDIVATNPGLFLALGSSEFVL